MATSQAIVGCLAVRELGRPCRIVMDRPTRGIGPYTEAGRELVEGSRPASNEPGADLLSPYDYHRPWLLDDRVRDGIGYGQPGMGTGQCTLLSSRSCVLERETEGVRIHVDAGSF